MLNDATLTRVIRHERGEKSQGIFRNVDRIAPLRVHRQEVIVNISWLIPAAITAGLLALAVFALVKILRADGLGILEEDQEPIGYDGQGAPLYEHQLGGDDESVAVDLGPIGVD